MRNRAALLAVALSLAPTGALVVRIVAINKPGVVVILLPALAGALLAIWNGGRVVLIASALLTALTAAFGLIGGWGLLYLPSIVLFVWGALSSKREDERAAHVA